MKFLIIDNYDSFVYNIAQRLGELGITSDVIRNDRITIKNIEESNYDAIIISPGPGTPDDERYFGICKKVITELGPTKPILGVCLGHQGIISCFGGKVVNAKNIRHGKTSQVKHTDESLFVGVKNETLSEKDIFINEESAATIMLVSKGYPGKYKKGKVR